MRSVRESLQEYARGVTGGLLFSLPLLYTMEVWWAGFVLQPYHLLLYMAVTFVLLLGYNRYSGVHPGAGWKEVMIDSVEEIGIGLLLSAIVLWMIGRIDFTTMAHDEIMGKVIIETMTVAIGVSVGTAQLGVNETYGNSEDVGKDRHHGIVAQIVLTFCGSVLIAGNVAPTEEIPMIAFQTPTLKILVLMVASLLLGGIILFFSDFRGTRPVKPNGTVLITIFGQTCLAYVVALGSSAFMLSFFGRFEHVDLDTALHQVIVLGMPAMLGACAGRLLIK